MQNPDLIASLVQFQKKRGRLSKTNLEDPPTPTPSSNSDLPEPPKLSPNSDIPVHSGPQGHIPPPPPLPPLIPKTANGEGNDLLASLVQFQKSGGHRRSKTNLDDLPARQPSSKSNNTRLSDHRSNKSISSAVPTSPDGGSNDFLASLVQFQKNRGQRLRKTTFEDLPAPTPSSGSNALNGTSSSNSFETDLPELKNHKPLPVPVFSVKTDDLKSVEDEGQNGDARPSVANRLAMFENQKKKAATRSRTTVTIRVGSDENQKVFEADVNALRVASAYFRRYFPRNQTPESLDLPDEDPQVFSMFIEWSKYPKKVTKYAPGQYSKDEAWISHAASAWLLAYRLGAPRFEMYALSQFLQNCAIMVTGPWNWIEDNVPSSSALGRFSTHWVAWNAYFCGSGPSEYTGLVATGYITQVKSSTRDPRIFDLDHWYSDCGANINAKCEHDPITKENKERENERREKPPPEIWGAELEILHSSEAEARAQGWLD